jgi:plasmid stabilization system protein ParE
MTLSFSAAAAEQIAEIYRYVAGENPLAAQKVLRRILEIAEFVAEHPGAGHATTIAGLRAIPANPYPYVVYFRGSLNGVAVLRVLHSARRRSSLREEQADYRVSY